MEKQTYDLAEELISAREARIKTIAIQSGLLLDVQKLNKAIKDTIAAKGERLLVCGLSDGLIQVLQERGYSIEHTGARPNSAIQTFIISW